MGRVRPLQDHLQGAHVHAEQVGHLGQGDRVTMTAKALLQLSCDAPQVRDCRQHEPKHLGEQERTNNKMKDECPCSYKQYLFFPWICSQDFQSKTYLKVMFSHRLSKFLVLLRHTLLQSSKAVMISLSLVSGVKKSFVCSILQLISNYSNAG